MNPEQQRDLILDILRVININFELLGKIPEYSTVSENIAMYKDITLPDAELAVYESILLLEQGANNHAI